MTAMKPEECVPCRHRQQPPWHRDFQRHLQLLKSSASHQEEPDQEAEPAQCEQLKRSTKQMHPAEHANTNPESTAWRLGAIIQSPRRSLVNAGPTLMRLRYHSLHRVHTHRHHIPSLGPRCKHTATQGTRDCTVRPPAHSPRIRSSKSGKARDLLPGSVNHHLTKTMSH
jgi:hypothetical protein